jgi:hypothetical protein
MSKNEDSSLYLSMNAIDNEYQNAVDNEANKLLKLTVEEFLKIEDYGSVNTIINGKQSSCGFWHYAFDDNLHHIFFAVQRSLCLFGYRKYVSGAKLENGKIVRLTDEECGHYD